MESSGCILEVPTAVGDTVMMGVPPAELAEWWVRTLRIIIRWAAAVGTC